MAQLQEQISIQQEQIEQMSGEIDRRMEKQRDWMQNQFEQIQRQMTITAVHMEHPDEDREVPTPGLSQEGSAQSHEEIEIQQVEVLEELEESEE